VDQPGRLRRGHDVRGGVQRAVGVAQPQQGLVLRLLAACDRHDRLVGQFEAVLGQCLAQARRQLAPAFGVLAGRWRVAGQADRRQPRLAQRLLGRLQRGAGLDEAVAQRHVPDRHPQLQPPGFAVHLEQVPGDAVAQAAGQVLEPVRPGVWREHQEGVVVEPGRRIAADQAAQHPPGLGHQPLQRGIAVALAQAAHALDLHEQHAATFPARQGIAQALQQVAAGHQPGERVAAGVAHALLAQGARAPDPALHRGHQVARTDRLAEEVVGARLQDLVLLLRVRVAGQEHDRGVQEGLVLADQHRQFGARQSRHVQVHQHQVRPEPGHGLQHVVGFGRDQRLDPRAVEHALGEQRLGTVVLDDQHPVRRLAGGGGDVGGFGDVGGIGHFQGAGGGVCGVCGWRIAGPAAPVMRRGGFGALGPGFLRRSGAAARPGRRGGSGTAVGRHRFSPWVAVATCGRIPFARIGNHGFGRRGRTGPPANREASGSAYGVRA
jgi:hypothetical protein